MQTLKITGAGTLLAPFTAATIALGTTIFHDVTNFNQANPFESTSKLFEKFGNLTKSASEFFFSGSKAILNESGNIVKTVVDEAGSRLKITAHEIGYEADILTDILGGKSQAVLFDGVGSIVKGVKSFVGLGKPALEVNLNDAQPALLPSSPTTTVKTAQAATPVEATAAPVEQPAIKVATVSAKPALLPTEASAKLSALINDNPAFKKAVDNSGDIKLTLSDSEQKHIISLTEKITKVSGTNFTDTIPTLVSLKLCEATSAPTISKFSAIQKYAKYIDNGGDLENAEMKLTSTATSPKTAGYSIFEQVSKIIPAEKAVLCSLYEQVKTTAEYQNIFTTETAKAEYCHAEPSSVLCADMFSDLFVASNS